ncbi:MAG: DUF309 domain-containing protein [Acidobacteria bacterium]|nr:DUF309 domain-containing protein [Acidobacteriota bacterium]
MKPSIEPAVRRHLLDEGARLLASRQFYKAHEAFEDLWKAASRQQDRDLWQGLSQLAAALVKHDRREPTTAISLLAKAKSRLTAARLAGEGGTAMIAYLDALAGPIAQEKELPDTKLPKILLEALRAVE